MTGSTRVPVLLFLLGLTVLPLGSARGDQPTPLPVPSGWLGLPGIDAGGRTPFNASVVFERYLWKPDAPPPHEGETVRGVSGREAAWRALAVDEKGAIAGEGLGVAYATVASPEDAVRLLEVVGVAALYLNGDPVGGDVYGHGITEVPVKLRQGTNHLFAAGFRGKFRVAFHYCGSPVHFFARDATVPDVVPDAPLGETAGVVLVNATEEELSGLDVSGSFQLADGGADTVRFPLRARGPVTLPPLGSRKVCLEGDRVEAPAGTGKAWLVAKVERDGRILDQHVWDLDVRPRGEAYRATFRSGIDDSAQFYGVLEPAGAGEDGVLPVLTLHGAGVDALNQARAYSARPGVWVVAPTNRRPFGFDWQDWGREDAYEVMAHARRVHELPERFCLTGHSMGGHGAWHLAVNDPDRFRAVAPSAGWCSFDTYGGGPPGGALAALWRAADLASQTDALLGNLADMPVYVLHGTDDDNVPVRETQDLVRKLEGVARHLEVHYAEGKGHWWDGDAAPGADCVDWPGIFEVFRAAPAALSPADFAWKTADLSVDAEHDGFRVEQPLQYGTWSTVTTHCDAEARRLEVVTSNVRRLVVKREALRARGCRTLSIDGQELGDPLAGDGAPDPVVLVRHGGTWRAGAADPTGSGKRPERMGPFKRAFGNRFVLVYGTAGSDAEDAALLASARYDAEQWRYRANGQAECVTDLGFLADEERYRDRNVILYGNASTNAAWDAVVPASCPIRVERGKVRAGVATWEGDGLGVLLVYPRRGSATAQVGVVGDTGVPGARLQLRIPCFLSGVGLPDYVIYGPEVLRRGDEGVRAAGFFDVAWRLAD